MDKKTERTLSAVPRKRVTNLPSPKAIIAKLEDSMWEVAKQYQGDGAFFFYNEADVRCKLFSCIQKNMKDTQIVHAEWRSTNPFGFYDLVVWSPNKKDDAKRYWGKDTPFIMGKVPRLILAGIEIDCLYGGCGKANQFTTYKRLYKNPDIRKLIRGIGTDFKYSYFLMFWDDEAASVYSKTAQKIDDKFKGLAKKHKIRSICISREKVVFVHGFMSRDVIKV